MELTPLRSARKVAPPDTRIPPSGGLARLKIRNLKYEHQPCRKVKKAFMNVESRNLNSQNLVNQDLANQNSTNQWTLYHTRFLVRAQQLTAPLVFIDALGREQSGQPGDYLVETAEGIKRITTQALFEDIYVPLVQNLQGNNSNDGLPAVLSRPVSRSAPTDSAQATA
jgi:hypothetical protein